MQRRKAIAAMGAATVAALAGCASSDDTEYEDGGDNGGGGDGDGGGSQEALEIVEHDLVIDEGQFTTDVTVEGVVENTGDERASYVEVNARVYDPDGNQLDSYFTNTQDLDPGSTWAFEINVLEDAEDVDDYDIAVEDSAF